MRKPFTPTKACPHRWCRPAHNIISVTGLLIIAGLLYKQTAVAALVLVMCVLATAAYAILTKRNMGEAMLDTVDLAPITPLTVRQGWATTAVVIDWVVVGGGSSSILSIATAPTSRGTLPARSAAELIFVIAGGVGLVVFHRLAHYLATRPGKRRRVFQWRPARATN